MKAKSKFSKSKVRKAAKSHPTHDWKCPECGDVVKGVTCNDILEVGTPYCSECDCEMELVEEPKYAGDKNLSPKQALQIVAKEAERFLAQNQLLGVPHNFDKALAMVKDIAGVEKPKNDKKVRLRLTVEVDYIPNGVPSNILEDALNDLVKRAVDNGLMTVDTLAEVENWNSSVSTRGNR